MIGPIDDFTVQRARRGDADAFGELLRAHQASARRVATVVLGTNQGVDDVMQDAAIRSWQRLETFRPGADFGPWFLRVVANTAKNRHRSAGRRAAMVLRAQAEPANDAPQSPDEVIERRNAHQQLIAGINRLGTDDRLVLALRYFEELSTEEMAEVMDCATGTVKSRLSRATARLRAELQTTETYSAGSGR